MNFLKERVSYLKGLAEGMQINDSSNEGKLLKAIIDVLDDIALSVDDIEEVQEQLSSQVDDMDEDLAGIERILFDDDGDYDEDDDDDEDYDEGDEEEDDDECDTELECPHCGETIVLEEAFIKKDSILCPNCHKEIEIEWTCDDKNCDGSCEDEDSDE